MKGFERRKRSSRRHSTGLPGTTFEEGVVKVATGEGAHYQCLTFPTAKISKLRQRRTPKSAFRHNRDDGLDGLTV